MKCYFFDQDMSLAGSACVCVYGLGWFQIMPVRPDQPCTCAMLVTCFCVFLRLTNSPTCCLLPVLLCSVLWCKKG